MITFTMVFMWIKEPVLMEFTERAINPVNGILDQVRAREESNQDSGLHYKTPLR